MGYMGAYHHTFAIEPHKAWAQPPGERPLVSPGLLASLLQSLTEADMQAALRHGLVPVAWLPYQVFHAQCDGFAAREGFQVVARIDRAVFEAGLQQAFAKTLARKAAFGLARNKPALSARQRMNPAQALVFAVLAALIGVAIWLLPASASYHIFGMGFLLFFGSMVWLRVLALNVPANRKRQEPERDDERLPVYSVLVPLFREVSVLPQLVAALGSLNYPSAKLDIKLILEEADLPMRQAVAAMKLPAHFQVLVVPRGKPQTKPRALNYALHFARGNLITIYDAEDIPEPMQLRMAVKAFADLPKSVACLQAELAFYNPAENWLARQFTIEYATLFKLVLPALAAHHMPLPLGGTSNHFRREALELVGGWDAHNVTEDADLGFRLARFGFQTSVLDSITFEEATSRLGGWVHQRARWFKGFLQTWLVHMRHPLALLRETGWAGFLTLQAGVLGVVVSAALYPFFLVLSVYRFLAFDLDLNGPASLMAVSAEGLYLGLFVTGQAVMIFSGAEALWRKRISGWGVTLAGMPFYWLLGGLAAWLALWQLLHSPFHWNKTSHGVSRFVLRPAAKITSPL
jgi:glycosyltransferase XagB